MRDQAAWQPMVQDQGNSTRPIKAWVRDTGLSLKLKPGVVSVPWSDWVRSHHYCIPNYLSCEQIYSNLNEANSHLTLQVPLYRICTTTLTPVLHLEENTGTGVRVVQIPPTACRQTTWPPDLFCDFSTRPGPTRPVCSCKFSDPRVGSSTVQLCTAWFDASFYERIKWRR